MILKKITGRQELLCLNRNFSKYPFLDSNNYLRSTGIYFKIKMKVSSQDRTWYATIDPCAIVRDMTRKGTW